jgi:hypothetical protein
MQSESLNNAIAFSLKEVRKIGDPLDLPLPIQTVVLVHAAQGLIDNGGLRWFFEKDFDLNPDYAVFTDAYRRIGANKAAAAIQEAVELFGLPDPHRREGDRNKYLDRHATNPKSRLSKLSDALCGNQDVWNALQKYVDKHMDSF